MSDEVAIRLLHRPADAERGQGTAVVVCHGFIQNRHAFETPERSLLAHLCAQGHDVYVLELSMPHERDASARVAPGLHAYADEIAPRALEQVLGRHDRVAWLGHSMGGIVGVSLPPAVSERLSALAVVGAPLVPGLAGARLLQAAVAAAARRLARRGAPFPGRALGKGFLRASALLDHRLARYPFQVWCPGALPRADLEFALKSSFADDSWGAFADLLELGVTRGQRAGSVDVGARLARLRRPLLVVGGDRDGLAPLPSTRPLFERAGAHEKRFVEVSARTTGAPFGHIDLLVGARAPAYVWPHLTRFFAAHLLDAAGAARVAAPPALASP